MRKADPAVRNVSTVNFGDGRRTARPDTERRDRNFRDSRTAPMEEQRSPRRRGKAMAIPKVERGTSRREGESLLNTSLADQLAALRDKIISSKK